MVIKMSSKQEKREYCFRRMYQVQDTEDDGLYCNTTWDSVMCWDRVEAGTIARQPCPTYEFSNSAGFASRECLINGTWKTGFGGNSTEGWTNFSECVFGGVNQPQLDLPGHMSRIKIMSEIGYGISLVALVIAVLVMILSKRLHCKSNSLHINLFAAFIFRASITFIKSTLFVEGVALDKDVILSPGGVIQFKPGESHWECKLLVTVFLYTVSASLMWIFMEGLYLHMLVYRTYFTERHGVRFYFIIGWFSPLLYLIPWVIVRINFDDEMCWNSYKIHALAWIIKGPIVLTVLTCRRMYYLKNMYLKVEILTNNSVKDAVVGQDLNFLKSAEGPFSHDAGQFNEIDLLSYKINFVFFIDIVRVLCKRVRSHRYPKGSSKHLRKIAKFALVLIPLFGVIYIGFAAYPQGFSMEADMIYLYCEMFYNSIQGFLLALLFCFLNEEVQNEVRRYWFRKRFTGFGSRSVFSSLRKPSRFSRTSSLTVGHGNGRVGKTETKIAGSILIYNRQSVPLNWKSTYRSKDESFEMDTTTKGDSSKEVEYSLHTDDANNI